MKHMFEIARSSEPFGPPPMAPVAPTAPDDREGLPSSFLSLVTLVRDIVVSSLESRTREEFDAFWTSNFATFINLNDAMAEIVHKSSPEDRAKLKRNAERGWALLVAAASEYAGPNVAATIEFAISTARSLPSVLRQIRGGAPADKREEDRDLARQYQEARGVYSVASMCLACAFTVEDISAEVFDYLVKLARESSMRMYAAAAEAVSIRQANEEPELEFYAPDEEDLSLSRASLDDGDAAKLLERIEHDA
jgi:hypothetical protein